MAIYRENYVDVELTSGGIFRSFLSIDNIKTCLELRDL